MTILLGFFGFWMFLFLILTAMLAVLRLITNGFDFKGLVYDFNIDKKEDEREEKTWGVSVIVIFIITGILSFLMLIDQIEQTITIMK